ncbi:hypothetical protein Tco_0705419 [Tanacetum coccineum]|uniref:Uncharacterized protein n=1 Tax=Tanacetum coccineum TaxID=301880 RepID=A0ABQ4Y621_9ASTR
MQGSDKLRHDQKCKNMKLSQDMQLIQKLRDDQKRMKKVFEVMSGTEEIKLEYSSRSSKIFSRNTGLHSHHFSLFLLVGNIVTNSRVTPSWREIVSLTFSEAGVLHVNWTSFGHCVPRRGLLC